MKKTQEHKLAKKVADVAADLADALAAKSDARVAELIESMRNDNILLMSVLGKFLSAYQICVYWALQGDDEGATATIRAFANWTRTAGAVEDEANLIIDRALEHEGGA